MLKFKHDSVLLRACIQVVYQVCPYPGVAVCMHDMHMQLRHHASSCVAAACTSSATLHSNMLYAAHMEEGLSIAAVHPSYDDIWTRHLSVRRQPEANPSCGANTNCEIDPLRSKIESPEDVVVVTELCTETVLIRKGRNMIVAATRRQQSCKHNEPMRSSHGHKIMHCQYCQQLISIYFDAQVDSSSCSIYIHSIER